MKVIIDVNHSFHKSYFIFSKWGNDVNTELGQGRLMRKATSDLFASVNKLWIKPEEVYFCFDSHTWRKEASLTYKADRSSKPDGFYTVINEMYSLMKEKGYKAMKVDQAESDDCISFLVQVLEGEKLIISADEDMHQLINSKVSVWNNNLQKPIIFLPEPNEKAYFNFKYQKIVVNPELSFFKKLMLGCSGDNISALINKKGVGEKSIEKLYQVMLSADNDKSIDFLEKTIEKMFGYSRPDFMEKYKENYSLVDLSLGSLPEDILLGISDESEVLEALESHKSFEMSELLSGTKYFYDK